MTSREPVVVATGLSYLEGPRWHEGKLWASDFYTHRVLSFDADGTVTVEATLDDQPSGIDWLPDGSLLVAAMRSRTVLRFEGGRQSVYADLTDLASWHLNDLVVDARGYTYVGNFGFDLMNGGNPSKATVVCIDPDGKPRVVVDEAYFPNGTVITPDGGTMIMAESFAQRLTAFDLGEDGSLTNRRVWASFGEEPTATTLDDMLAQVSTAPDGISLDEEGCVWFADGFGQRLVRAREGGEIVEEIPTEEPVFACMLGGASGRTLYVCSAPSFAEAEASTNHRARLLAYEVDAARAGRP